MSFILVSLRAKRSIVFLLAIIVVVISSIIVVSIQVILSIQPRHDLHVILLIHNISKACICWHAELGLPEAWVEAAALVGGVDLGAAKPKPPGA